MQPSAATSSQSSSFCIGLGLVAVTLPIHFHFTYMNLVKVVNYIPDPSLNLKKNNSNVK